MPKTFIRRNTVKQNRQEKAQPQNEQILQQNSLEQPIYEYQGTPNKQQHSKYKNENSKFSANLSSQSIIQVDTSKENYTNKDDDVHSKRLKDLSPEEYIPLSYKRDLYKFCLDHPQNAKTLDLSDINIVNIENEDTFHLVPELKHELEQIVHKPGIYTMDEMAKVQEDGGQFLRNIYNPNELDMDNIPSYTPPSQDKLLLKFAQESKIKYIMSTSTISSVMVQLYYLVSQFRNPSFKNISEDYIVEPKKYMVSQRKPITVYLRNIDKNKGIYAVDSDPGLFYFKNYILMDLGKVLERSCTMEPDSFRLALLKKDHPDYIKASEKRQGSGGSELIPDDHHRFMKLNNEICLRSQIDCKALDPATGKPFVFEIKTRSICPIRYDIQNYEDYLDYTINSYRGLHSSFEREYYDLIRGAFLKYSFQLKIGQMDGAFLAYHNTREIFGFEYIKRSEIEKRVFGSQNYAEAAFLICSKILTTVLDNILEDISGYSYAQLKIGFYACSSFRKMYIFVELDKQACDWGKEGLIEQTNQFKDELDYFTKFKKLENKVLKYELILYNYLNGVLLRSQQQNVHPWDQLQVKYKVNRLGYASFIDYMNFLHEAYKLEAINLDLTYSGAWIKQF